MCIRDRNNPTVINLAQTNGIIEAENYYTKHNSIILENNNTSIGYLLFPAFRKLRYFSKSFLSPWRIFSDRLTADEKPVAYWKT